MGVIEEMRRRINKIRWERWRAKQNKELEKSYCYSWVESWSVWGNWQECPGSGDCHSVSGAYIDFYIGCWRSGASDCGGGSGSWNAPSGPCMYNVAMRFARAGESSSFYDVLSKCYWKEHGGCSEHCYMEEYGWNKPIYEAGVTNNSIPFGHAICAEYLGGDVTNFNNWKFFQYDNLNIQPGDWQMPCGTDEENTKVRIRQIESIRSCGGSIGGDYVACFEIDKNCNVISVSCPSK